MKPGLYAAHHPPCGCRCYCEDCRTEREQAITANARRGVRRLFSPASLATEPREAVSQ